MEDDLKKNGKKMEDDLKKEKEKKEDDLKKIGRLPQKNGRRTNQPNWL